MGLFDSAGEKLYKEMDRAMRDFAGATPSTKAEILVKTEALISSIEIESERWSPGGKQKAARHLQAEGRRQRDFDIAAYITQFFAGAWLEAKLLQDDPHARHVLKTIELLRDESESAQIGSAKPDDNTNDMGPLVEMCLTAVLAVYFADQTTDLACLLSYLEFEADVVTQQVHALAFGMIDGLAQLKQMTQSEHLATASLFFLTYINSDPSAAAMIVGRLIRIKPGHSLYDFIRAGGRAMVRFGTTQDVGEFTNLAKSIG